MPPTYFQANRAMTVTTPLGPDVLLLVGFSGHEGISQLFSFELDLAAKDQSKVVFEKLLGRKMAINLQVSGGQKRYFSGICTSVTQGMRGIDHTSFQMEISPHCWLLTRRARSRIFQNQSVPEILKAVLDIPEVTYDLEGTFHPRTYCVQYRETDFNFASRLMEEEGIYYYFKHKADGHQMVVSNKAAFPELQPAELLLQQSEGTHVQEERITRWQKRQQLRSLKVTLRDHHFQMPQKSLEAGEEIQDELKVGKVAHKLKIGESDELEIYDWPGAYAHRFDAIDRGGADRPDELQKLLKDNERTAKIRMEQEAAEAIVIQGSGRYRHLVSGHTFTLKEQVVVPYEGSGSHDGKYVLTSVNHTGRLSSSYRSGDAQELLYDNSFTCIPSVLTYRPQRATSKPVALGTQTAVVVGPKAEQIHTDKHGRVKVQFHWDREGKHDAASSCWIRVTQAWADKGFGAICLPRAGQEVVVGFEEGDPDRPLILGSVYNADNPPPFKLPENRMFSGIKTNSVHGSPAKNFSGLAFNDTRDGEHVALYSEKNMMLNAENNHQHHVGNYQHAQVGRMSLSTVGSIPGIGGGGSGGGGSNGGPSPTPTPTPSIPASQQPDTADSDPNKPPSTGDWKTSNGLLSAQPGLVGSTIYGVNSQDTVGFMHQVTIGAAYQICVNPFGFWGCLAEQSTLDAPPFIAGYIGGALGGNVQITWGANTQAVYGTAVNINHGPQITITSKKWDPDKGGSMSGLTEAMAIVVPALSAVYELVYAFMGSQEDSASTRAKLAASSAILIPLATGVLLGSEMIDKSTRHAEDVVQAGQEATGRVATVTKALGLTDTELIQKTKDIAVVHVDALTVATKPGLTPMDEPNRINYVDGALVEVANSIRLVTRRDITDETASLIDIDAEGNGSTGVAYVHATNHVTLSSGDALVILTGADGATEGVTVQCGNQDQILLCRTLDIEFNRPRQQRILMEPGWITIDGGVEEKGIVLESSGNLAEEGVRKITLDQSAAITITTQLDPAGTLVSTVKLDPFDGIKLSCGENSITINKTGVTIDALNITLNANVQYKETSQIKQIQATLGQLGIKINQLQ